MPSLEAVLRIAASAGVDKAFLRMRRPYNETSPRAMCRIAHTTLPALRWLRIRSFQHRTTVLKFGTIKETEMEVMNIDAKPEETEPTMTEEANTPEYDDTFDDFDDRSFEDPFQTLPEMDLIIENVCVI
jgi:hypothetical protein